jgi:hypothetical protein
MDPSYVSETTGVNIAPGCLAIAQWGYALALRHGVAPAGRWAARKRASLRGARETSVSASTAWLPS